MSLRFLLQPTVATFLAIRAGLSDAREGRPAFLWSLLTESGARALRAKECLRDVGKVLILALVLDFLYQIIVLRGVYLLELLFTASLLALVPYVLLRGPVNRIARLARSLDRSRHEGRG